MEAMLSRADRARLRESEAKLRSLVSALEGTRCSGDVLHDELMAIKSEQNDNANVQPRFKPIQTTNAAAQVACYATSESDSIYSIDQEYNVLSQYRYKEHIECSGRGACDTGSGICSCYKPDPDGPKGLGEAIPTNTREYAAAIMEKVRVRPPPPVPGARDRTSKFRGASPRPCNPRGHVDPFS